MAPAATDGAVVAVLALDAEGLPQELRWLGSSFADATVTFIANKTRGITLVERMGLDLVLGELELQRSAAFDPDSAVRAGRLLGATVVVVGALGELGEDWVARARLVDVATGEVLAAVEARGPASRPLTVQRRLATRIGGALSGVSPDADAAASAARDLSVGDLGKLERIRQLARSIPPVGLDPARRRRMGDYNAGITLCDELVAGAPDVVEVLRHRALFALQLGDHGAVDDALERALEARPGDARTLALRANAAFARRDVAAAVADANAAIATAPADPLAHLVLAHAHLRKSDDALAVAALLDALERGAPRGTETTLRALLSGRAGAATLDVLARRDAQAAAAARAAAALWGSADASTEVLDAVVADRPALYLGWAARARARLARGETSAALTDLAAAVALAPTSPDVQRTYALALIRAGRCDRAEDHVRLYRRFETALSDGRALDAALQACRS